MKKEVKIDLREIIEEAIKKLKENPKLLTEFQSNPSKAVKLIVGDKIPEEAIDAIISGIQTKLTADSAQEVIGKLGNLFGKRK